jgi:hypothetical protein
MDEFQRLASVTDPNANVMANLLKSEFDRGLLDEGQRGEVVFRQLIWEAYRRAVQEDHPKDIYHCNFSKGCKLTTFIKKLFSKGYANQVLNSVPDNIKSSITFEARFKNAIVRFTHFGKMADDTGTTTHAMFAAFVRCMAVICWSSQEVADILIPILLEEKEKLEESVMTGLLIQIKWRNRHGSSIQYQINQTELGFFPSDSLDERPYIALVAELGLQPPISAAATMPSHMSTKVCHFTPEPPKEPTVTRTSQTSLEQLDVPNHPARIRHPSDVHPCYSIFAYGCSDKVYGIINGQSNRSYALLLRNHDMLDEHPRLDADSLGAVQALKPFWSAGLNCYCWIDDEYLQKYQVLGDVDEGLFVGHYEDEDSTSETGM